jgi:hypothetical protein
VHQQGLHTIRAELPRILGFVPAGWERQQRVQMKAGLRLPLGRQRNEAVVVVEELGLLKSVPVKMVGGRVGKEDGMPDL